MPDEQPSLQIDTDWKKQAQEEKRRLAEQAKEREQQAASAAVGVGAMPGAGAIPSGVTESAAAGGRRAPGGAASRELPPATFASLVQSVVTQALYHLGDLAVRGGEPVVNLDMAKHHIDTLGVIEAKTVNNITEDEKRMLDAALYETRMRYVNVASRYIS